MSQEKDSVKNLNPSQNSKFEISVKVTYEEKESRPEANYYFFSYNVTIKNLGTTSAQLMSRQWLITDAFGNSEEVRGAGVVGLQPKIAARSEFQYESACPLTTASGNMKGYYHFVDENGETFEVEIPEFYLIAPSALH